MTYCDYVLGLVFSTFNSFKQLCKLGIVKPGFTKIKPKKIMPTSCMFRAIVVSSKWYLSKMFIFIQWFKESRDRNYVWTCHSTCHLHHPLPVIINYRQFFTSRPPCWESHSSVALISTDLQVLPKPKAAVERLIRGLCYENSRGEIH